MLERTLYLAYGANMHPGQMSWRCPKALASKAFILRDWELRFYSHDTIAPKKGAKVAGVLWEITSECESSLDAFEGYPSYYTKQTWIQDDTQFFFYEMTTPKSGALVAERVGRLRHGPARPRRPALGQLENDFS